MTDFMTALPVQPIYPGDLQAASTSSRPATFAERATKLSFLSTSTSAAFVPVPNTSHAQSCLKSLKNAIEKSDAMLYAPSAVQDNCKVMSLRCYILELLVVIMEQEIVGPKANCIFDFNDRLPKDNFVGCRPCEAYSLKNITVFLDGLNNLLEEMTTQLNT
ncbi:interleukin-15 isoform X4 [Perca flavescens]|uniref:interleukin-15 isoform X4 n=1 Tax=Perca flavescens TaxID=8167 RepID=UPI00106DE0FF|nr:interleukin-15 isoform X4 [Perca flavescens]